MVQDRRNKKLLDSLMMRIWTSRLGYMEMRGQCKYYLEEEPTALGEVIALV